MIKAQIVGDSISGTGSRITTMLVTFPRIILAELNTHRVFSRNSASSRAIPFEKMIKAVKENPFIPIAWQKNHKGMQGTEYITDPEIIELERIDWLVDRDYAIGKARKRAERGITKQIVNRPLEPFMWHTCIITATEWENFFALRCPRYKVTRIKKMNPDDIEDRFYRSRKDLLKENAFEYPMTDLQWLQINEGQAEIHMMALAEAMWDAYNESTPKQLKKDEWHIPYEAKVVDLIPPTIPIDTGVSLEEGLSLIKAKIATVMAARTSYTVIGNDQKPLTYQRMLEIHDQMRDADPIHASPFEHCAKNTESDLRSRNFTGGWMQYRQMIEGTYF